MTPGSSVKEVFGLGPLSPANAGGMLAMLRAARAARIASFMISLRAHRRRACLSNLVGLAAEIGFTRRRDNPAGLEKIYAERLIIITRANRGWLVAGGTIDRLRRSAPT